jgi:hypothetical protein
MKMKIEISINTYSFRIYSMQRTREEKEKKKKGNLTRFEIVDIYDDRPCVCRKFTTQIK